MLTASCRSRLCPYDQGCPRATKHHSIPLLPPQPQGPKTPLCGSRIERKSSVLIPVWCRKLLFWEGKGRGKHPPLPFPVQDHSCSGTAEAIRAARRGHGSPSVLPGWLCQCGPCCDSPGDTAGRGPAVPPCPVSPCTAPFRKLTFKDHFRPPQTTVKKLWLLVTWTLRSSH